MYLSVNFKRCFFIKWLTEQAIDDVALFIFHCLNVYEVITRFLHMYMEFNSKKVAIISNRYNQVSYLTQDATLEPYKNTVKHHKQ